MLIQCPECQFSRTLDEAKIPPTAHIATCPRCKARFRFRDLEEGQEGGPLPHGDDGQQFRESQTEDSVDARRHSSSEGGAGEKGEFHAPGGRDAHDPRKEEKPRDLWDHIASLGEKWDQHKSAHGNFQGDNFEEGARAGIVPWEHPEQFGLAGGFFKTVMRVLMRGKLFFSSMPQNSRLGKPLAFYFLVIALHFLVSFFWIYLFSQNAEVAASLEQFHVAINQTSILQLLVFIPVNAALTLVMLGFTFSLVFRLAGVKGVNLVRNLRILCYASSGLLLVVIPLIGPVMSSLFVVFSTFQGFAYSYNIPPAKAGIISLSVYLLLFLIVIGTSVSAL